MLLLPWGMIIVPNQTKLSQNLQFSSCYRQYSFSTSTKKLGYFITILLLLFYEKFWVIKNSKNGKPKNVFFF